MEAAVQGESNPTEVGRLPYWPFKGTHIFNIDMKAAISVGLLLLGVYWLTMGGHTYSVDDETYLAGVRALARHTTVITPTPDTDGILSLVLNRNGDFTTAAPIGSLLLLVPGFIAGKLIAWPFPASQQEEIVRLATLSTNGLLTAATGAMLVLLCIRLGARRSSAVLLGMTFGLGTWAWAHSQTGFSEPGTAFALTGALLAATAWWTKRSPLTAGVAGLLAGCVVLTRASAIVFIPILLLSGVISRDHRSARSRTIQGLWFCAGGLVPATVMALNAWVRFGDPLYAGYPALPFTTPIYEGVFGLLFSPGKGLVFYAPICVVVLFALRLSLLSRRRYTLTVASICAVHMWIYGRFDVWSGENAYGPRYLIPLLPIVIAMLAPVIDSGRHWLRGARVAAAVGFLVPGLLGTLMYFNAVYFVQQPGVLENIDLPTTTQTQQFLAWDFQPRSSPLMLQIRSLPDLVRNTAARLDGAAGGITPIPAPYEERIHWYARAIELDTWWAWWPAKDGAPAIYALLAVPLLLLVFGARLARRSWIGQSQRSPDANSSGRLLDPTAAAV